MSGRRAKAHRRTSQAVALASIVSGTLAALFPGTVLALPEGGTVAAGSATVSSPTATSMRVDQGTDRLIMDWTRFNIAANESVRFQQPNAASIALNRVAGQEPTSIYGSLSANGQIFLINPSGILFGASSRVDVGALTASTLNMSNQDFLAGQYRFTQDATHANAAVINQGVITAGPGGYVALLGAAARNEGVIQAQLGSIALAAGKAATLDMRGDGLIQFVVTDAVAGSVTDPTGKSLASYVSNTGTLQADGGLVTLQAKAATDIIKSVVNQEGVVKATSLVNRGGVIKLIAGDDVANTGVIGWQANLGKVQNASSGQVTNTGTLDVSAGESGAAQGQVTLAGEYVGHAGTILARGATDAAGGRVLLTSREKTVVTGTGTIDTSGVGRASAGTAVVWSDTDTLFYGAIIARGGSHAGDGGTAEISGFGNLNMRGGVDLSAPHGTTGSLLLDPATLTIAGGSGDGAADGTATFQGNATPGTINFADATPTTVYESEIEGLNAHIVLEAQQTITTSGTFGTAEVLVQTDRNLTLRTRNQVGDGAGGIDLTASVDGTNLVFRTQGTGIITITGSTDGGAAGNVTLGILRTAGGTIDITTGNGTIYLTKNINSDLGTNAGNVTFTGPVVLNANILIDARPVAGTSGNITFNNTINADAAANDRTLLFAINGTGSLVLNGAVGGTQPLKTISTTSNPVPASATLGAITTRDGGVNITGTTITLNGNISTNSISTAGPVTLTGAVTLGSNVTITADAATTDANISFTSTINADAAGNNRTLTLAAGTGSLSLGGAIGGSQALQTFTVSSAASAPLPAITTQSGGINVTATAITLGGNLSTDATATAGAVALSGAVTLTGNSTIDTDAGTTDANITFSSTINGGQALTLTSGTGDITISGTIGGSTALSSLTITGNDVTLANLGGGAAGVTGATAVTATTAGGDTGSLTFTGTTYNANAQTYTGPSGQTILVNGGAATTFTSTDDAITFGTATLLLANGSDLTVTSAGGAIAIAGGIRGTSSEDVTLTSSGGTTNTISVGQIGSADEINTIALTGSTSVTLSGDITTSNAAGNTVTITGPATLGANVTIATDTVGTDGNITFSSTVNADNAANNRTLTLAAGGADVTVSGAIGGSQPLQTFMVTSANTASLPAVTTQSGGISVTATNITLNGNLSTDATVTAGVVSLTGPVTLGGPVTVDTDGATTDATITFSGASSTINGAQALTVNGGDADVTFGGTIGGTTALSSLTVTGRNISLANIGTAGAAGVTGATSVTAHSFGAGTGRVTFTGTNYNANAQTYAAANLDVAILVNAGAPTTFTSTDDAITFTRSINLANGSDLIITSNGGAVSLIGINGNSSEDVTITSSGGTSNTVTVSTIGNSDQINTVAITAPGGITLNGNIKTSNAAGNTVTLTGPVTLGANISITTDNAAVDGAISFSSTVNADNAVNNRTLTLVAGTALLTISGAVGGSQPLQTFTVTSANTATLPAITTRSGGISVTATNITLNGNLSTDSIATAGAVTLTGAVTLGSGVTIDTDAATTDANITFSSTINGGQALTLTAGAGNVLVSGIVGGTTRLTSLTASGATVNVRAVSTTGAQSYTGAATLNGNLNSNTAGAITVTGAATLATGAIVVQTAGLLASDDITFGSTVNGGQALTLTAGAGDVLVSGIVGGTTPLGSLTASGNTINVQAVSTTGAQSYTGTTTLNGDLTTTNSPITLNSAANITTPISITAGTGTVTAASSLSSAGNALTITADEMEFSGGANSVTGTSTLLLRPSTPGLDITLGGPGGTAALDLTAAEVNALGNGFSSITIGRAADGTGMVTINPVTFNAPLTVVGGALTVGGLIDTGQSVTLTARTGDIQGSGAGPHLTAGTLTLTAVTGIGSVTPLLTSGVTTLTATTAGPGAATINLANTGAAALTVTSASTVGAGANLTLAQSGGGALTITSATTTDGAISLSNAGGNLTAMSVAAGGAGRNVTLATTGSGNMTVASVSALGDMVSANSAGDLQGSGGGPHLSADSLVLSAVNGIGNTTQVLSSGATTISATTTGAGAASIDLANTSAALTTITSATTTGTGAHITIAQNGAGGLTVTNATTSDGNVTLSTANGALTVPTVVAGGATRNATLTASGGDVLVGVATAGQTATLTAAGAITDTNGAANNITATNLVASAGTGLATLANPLETIVSNLEAVGGTGGLFITNTGALTIGGIGPMIGVSVTAGDIFITTASSMIVNEAATAVGAGNVTLCTGQTIGVDDLTLNALVGTGSGGINLRGGDNVALGANVTTTGTILISAGSAITSSAGTVSGTNVLLDASTGIGSLGAAVQTAASTLAARTTTSGGIFVSQTGALDIGSVAVPPATPFCCSSVLPPGGIQGLTTAGGNINVSTTNGTISVNQPVAASGSGTILLSAGGGGSNLTTSATLTSASGAITLTAGNNVTLGANVTTSGTVSVTATAGTVNNAATINTSSGNNLISITAGTGAGLTIGNLNAGTGVLSVSTGNSALDIGLLDAGTLTGSALSVTAGAMTTGSGLSFMGALTLASAGAITLTNAVSATGALTASATGALTGSGGISAGGNLTLNASSVGTGATPLTLTTIGGELSGTLSGTLVTDVFSVKSSGAITINLGLITAMAGLLGNPVTIDSSLGSILHTGAGTDIVGGRVNFWGTTIGTVGTDILVVTDNPPVFCNGIACGFPYFVNGSGVLGAPGQTLTIPDTIWELLNPERQRARLLTSGVLPTNVFACLNDEDEAVVCTAEGVWGDKKAHAKALKPNGSNPDTAETETPEKPKARQASLRR